MPLWPCPGAALSPAHFPDRSSTRIDLHIEVPAVEYRDISSTRTEENSDRDSRARPARAAKNSTPFSLRQKGELQCAMGRARSSKHCKLSDESQELIRVAMTELNLSARAYDRILKVSRTVADLAPPTPSPRPRERSHPISHLRSDPVGVTPKIEARSPSVSIVSSNPSPLP